MNHRDDLNNTPGMPADNATNEEDLSSGRWSPMETNQSSNQNEREESKAGQGPAFENRDWSGGRYNDDEDLWSFFHDTNEGNTYDSAGGGGHTEQVEASDSFATESSTRDSFSASSSARDGQEEDGNDSGSLEDHPRSVWAGAAPASGEIITPNRHRRLHAIPTSADVLLGRGELANTHPGNVRLRAERDRLRGLYKSTDRNKRKPIAIQLARMVHGWGGSFLVKDPGDNETWSEADDERAIKKCQHALREKQKKPSGKRKQPPVQDSKPPAFRRGNGGPPPSAAGGQVSV